MKTLFFLTVVHALFTGNIPTDTVKTPRYATDLTTKKTNADTATLAGQWYLQPLLAADTAAGKIPVLNINLAAGKFTGNTGCNTMRGSFQKTDTSPVFDQQIITTKMFCTGYDEAAFLRSLQRTNRYKIENGLLVLMFDATELSRWTRKPSARVNIRKA